MEDFGVKLHPVKKLKLWQTVKKVIFDKMDNESITTEQADKILGNIKSKIIEINSPKQAKELYMTLPQIYTELAPVTHKFEIEEFEALDRMLTLLLDQIMENGEFDIASKLMDRMENSDNHKKLIDELQNEFPSEFQIGLKRFSEKFT